MKGASAVEGALKDSANYTTIAATVQIFLPTSVARNYLEIIICHASHARFSHDTRGIHTDIWEMVNSHVECSFVHEIFKVKIG